MNKVVAVLAVIVVITLGALFFFAGFYMGNSSSVNNSTKEVVETEKNDTKKLSLDEINSQISANSSKVSNKVMDIISSGAENISTSVSRVMTKINYKQSEQMSADSLLKEIIAVHSTGDDCSVENTERRIKNPVVHDENSLNGKKIVFIGYFKDPIALQIQKLLISKGYKVHVEASQVTLGESFVFVGPFKKTENAEKLIIWLRKHDFDEAKLINVTNDSSDVSEGIEDATSVPENEERDIPEITESQIKDLALSSSADLTQSEKSNEVA